MNAIQRFLDHCFDSPTYGRDRANLITGHGIGIMALLLNGGMLMAMMSLLLNSRNVEMHNFADNIGFGQLLALILLGGAAVIATPLVPLRLATVFAEPRMGRYFDQIVLSGISPLRFLIGKVTSQNLFLILILFLLVPYFVLSLSLGGVNLSFFAAGLVLVWLYCMGLALATLWASLYVNEVIAALLVICIAGIISLLGCAPIPYQPFVLTPFPALLQPIHKSIPNLPVAIRDFLPTFVLSVVCMSAFIALSLTAIHLGPLYGIIRENSTFGEVIRTGDNQRKRKNRFRLHIQRPSELAFFYANRSSLFTRNEGLIRWGIQSWHDDVVLIIGLSVLAYATSMQLPFWGQNPEIWRVINFLTVILAIHAYSLIFAAIVFSHAKNTTYMCVSLFRGINAEVSKLDTTCFLLFALFSTAAAIATPFLFETLVALPAGTTVLPANLRNYHSAPIDCSRVVLEGTAVISIVGLVVYAFQRMICLQMWLRSIAAVLSAGLYALIVGMPLFFAVLIVEVDPLRHIQSLVNCTPILAGVSPFAVLVILFEGRLGGQFPGEVSKIPFYIAHFIALLLTVIAIRRRGRTLRQMYLSQPTAEQRHV